MHRTASCTCGAASITVNGEPQIYGVCHCANCKRRTGSAFGLSAYFQKKSVTLILGETLVYEFRHSSGTHDQQRHFCKYCGTTLFWYVSTLPELIGIAGGCFNGRTLGDPTMSMTHSEKMPWLTLPPDWTMDE